MHIFYTLNAVPMLLGTASELNALHSRLVEFLASHETATTISTELTHSPDPYDKFLYGLRLKKTQGSVFLRLDNDGWLELSGVENYLAMYVSHFRFDPPDDGHHHPDNANYMAHGSLSLIVEADSTWEGKYSCASRNSAQAIDTP